MILLPSSIVINTTWPAADETHDMPRHERPVTLLLIVTIAVVSHPSTSRAGEESKFPNGELPFQRTIHTFDFDERDDGNVENIPQYWREFGGESFPSYGGGRFDYQSGHEAAPSFYLGVNGRNVAYRYAGTRLPVIPNCDYTIGGWVLPDQLRWARAAMSAYYLDRAGLPISGSQRFSRLIGGDSASSGWSYIDVHLPAGPPQAAQIGLTLWVVQPEIWEQTPRPSWHIEYRDIRGGAWFDDITAYRLPRVSLQSAVEGNIFVAPATPRFRALISDHDGLDLEAVLDVRSSESNDTVWSCALPVDTEGHGQPTTVDFTSLLPGHYVITLEIRTEGRTVAARTTAFAYLAAETRSEGALARSFGVVLDEHDRASAGAELELVTALGVGAVKAPLWVGEETAMGMASSDYDVLLHGLIKRRVNLVGVLSRIPVAENAETTAPPSLLDILHDDPSVWGPTLSRVAAPYSSIFRSWQVGADGDTALVLDPRLDAGLARVRQQMLTVMTAPHLTAVGRAGLEPETSRLAAENLCLTLPDGIQPEWIADHVEGYRQLGYGNVSIYVPSPDYQGVDRLGCLSKWVKTILYARFTGADLVYVPQLWSSRGSPDSGVAEPSEEYVVFRTLVDLLNDAEPAEKFDIAEGARVLTFNSKTGSVWVMWDRAAEHGERTHLLQLGSATRQVDLWGRSQPLKRTDDGRHEVRLSEVPVFVDGIESWSSALRATARLNPDHADFTLGSHRHGLVLRNTRESAMTGEVQLVVPAAWEVKPATFRISLGIGEEKEFPIEFRLSGNESAGTKELLLKVRLQSPQVAYFEIPLTFHLDLKDLDVWGYAVVNGDRLILRHGVTNRSGQPLSFRAIATAPNRTRQSRIITNLQPGEMTTHEFLFARAADLKGRTVRLSLKEVDGGRVHNLDLQVP